jgi:hypothetical protein
MAKLLGSIIGWAIDLTIFTGLFWYCFDDALASVLGIAVLGSLPIHLVLVPTFILWGVAIMRSHALKNA